MVQHEIIGDDMQAVILAWAPGRVWLQTLPFSRLADRVLAACKGDREDVKRDFGGMRGGLGDVSGGDR